jgi:hypothetical protein
MSEPGFGGLRGKESTRLEVRSTKKIEDVHYEWKVRKVGEGGKRQAYRYYIATFVSYDKDRIDFGYT